MPLEIFFEFCWKIFHFLWKLFFKKCKFFHKFSNQLMSPLEKSCYYPLFNSPRDISLSCVVSYIVWWINVHTTWEETTWKVIKAIYKCIAVMCDKWSLRGERRNCFATCLCAPSFDCHTLYFSCWLMRTEYMIQLFGF